MAWLTKMTTRISANLRGLSLSQRLVILLGGLLVGGSLLWLVQWAASPEMVSLIPMDLEPEEIAEVTGALERMNEPFEVVGARVLVRESSYRPALIARLQQDDKLPDSTSTGFEALVKQNNPFLPQEENKRRWTVALANELRIVLRNFNGVRSADVFLDLSGGQQRMFGRRMESRASVTLKMKGGVPVTRKLAMGVARLVSGAVRGVTLRNVSVVDGNTGSSALEWEDENPESGPALQKLKAVQEKRIADKIRGQLGDPMARVSVQVELEMSSKRTQSSMPSEGALIKEETDESNRTRGSSAAQPGAQANVGVAAVGGGTQNSETRDTRTSEFQVGETLLSEDTPSGAIKQISAAINISFSYLESVFRRTNPDVEQPTIEQIISVFDDEKTRIVSQITKLVRPAEADQVAVDWYYDTVGLKLGAGGDEPGGASLDSTMDLVKQYGPQSAMGMLALISFALMLKMSKRIDVSDSVGLEIGLPAEHIEAAKRAARDMSDEAARNSPNDPGDELVEAKAASTAMAQGLLVGKEVDQPTLQMQSMLDQVSKFAKDDPEVVSALFERWVRGDD
ncbi:MAG: hypothetical protein IID33_04090 [Planctomycetes bacterium]|nr:hypothetical protein [Planctomycetota bacterium]